MSGLWLFLAALLAISATHKVIARERLAIVAARLAGSPAALGQPLLLGAACAETLAAVALAADPLRQAGALAAAAIWTGYAVALFARRGQVLDCGCDFVRRERPVSWPAIFRPAVLALMACAVTAIPEPAFALDAPFAALALLALYFAASELAALPFPARRSS